jgi:hypothetical protein
MQIWHVGMQGYESVLKGSEDGTGWCTWKWPVWFPTVVIYSGISKSICINMAPLACTQTLGTQKKWNKWYDNIMHMCQFCKLHLQFEQTVQVCATFKHTTLYVVVRIARFPCFIHHHVFLHNVLDSGSVPVLNIWVNRYSGESHRYLCSNTGASYCWPQPVRCILTLSPEDGERFSFGNIVFFFIWYRKNMETVLSREL